MVVQRRSQPQHAAAAARALDGGDEAVLLGEREQQVHDVVLLEAAIECRVKLLLLPLAQPDPAVLCRQRNGRRACREQ